MKLLSEYGRYGTLVVVGILMLIAQWKIFIKADEAGWKSLIPFYNIYVLYRIIWNTKMFWITLLLYIAAMAFAKAGGKVVSLLAFGFFMAFLVIAIKSVNKLAKAFGHGAGYTLGLLFLPYIFFMILGFGSDLYYGPQ